MPARQVSTTSPAGGSVFAQFEHAFYRQCLIICASLAARLAPLAAVADRQDGPDLAASIVRAFMARRPRSVRIRATDSQARAEKREPWE
jgi:hypothetical protein